MKRGMKGCVLLLCACRGPDGAAQATTDESTSNETGSSSTETATESDESSGGPRLDVAGDTDGGEHCKVVDDMDAVGPCTDQAPADSFDPDVQWSWWGPGSERQSSVIPLVANLTDDNDDGEIDLCDVPDLVVVASDTYGQATGHLHLLDGATGALHLTFAQPVSATVTPAVGDIDGDGLPEIVTSYDDAAAGQKFRALAFAHDGTLEWASVELPYYGHAYAVSIADLDNDGSPEVIHGDLVLTAEGELSWAHDPPTIGLTASVAADLDDDGDLEVVTGPRAFHHDGTLHYEAPAVGPGFAQVADLDADQEPEILVLDADGITLLEADGTIVYEDLRPTGDPAGGLTWARPATVHDFDGDQAPEFALSSRNHYAVYEPDATIVWSADVLDQSGVAAGTAFDFLGDGSAEAMYADEHDFFVYDASGAVIVSVPRSSWTNLEFPVVADVDNDGSAEVVVVSNPYVPDVEQTAPTVQVVRDAEDRWVPARRIWNQHAYHVTNVREDATIPAFEKPHWTKLNTFRTQAQVEGGGVCQPEPEG